MRILNLEDDGNDAELNQAMLLERWPDCVVIRVQTREEFAAALERETFDLILSDYSIPGFDGQSALMLAREHCPGVPFIFVSGTIGEERAIEAMKNGATDYVLKHRPERLVPAVERALREVKERQDRNQAEEAMRQSEHKYRELFECLADAAFLAEERSGRIIDTNRRATELTGVPREKIVGRKCIDFLEPTPGGDHLLRAEGKPALPVEVRDTPIALYGRSLILKLCREAERET